MKLEEGGAQEPLIYKQFRVLQLRVHLFIITKKRALIGPSLLTLPRDENKKSNCIKTSIPFRPENT